MFSENHYLAVLNFFYFLLLDETTALVASQKAVQLAEKMNRKDSKTKVEVTLTRAMVRTLKKYQTRKVLNLHSPISSEWKIPKKDYFVAWKEFMRKSDVDQSLILVLRYILNYDVKIIAQALDVPEGTVYFRLGRGLENFANNPTLTSVVKR